MVEETPQARGARMLRESGYEAPDDKVSQRMLMRRGGKVDGKKAAARPDRRARGGGLEDGGKKHAGKPSIKINIGAGGGAQQNPAAEQMAARAGLQQGMQIGAKMAGGGGGGGGGAPRPPMPPPGAGPAPGGPPMPPPGAMKRGGGMRRAAGGKIPVDLERKRGGEEYKSEERSAGEEMDKNHRRGGTVKVKAHERKHGGSLR